MEYKAKLDYPQLAETLTVEEQLKAMTEDRNLLWECYNSVIAERNKYKDALEAIANEEGSSCQRCEGNGSLWADGKAHLPSYGGATVRCGQCGGSMIEMGIKNMALLIYLGSQE